MNQRDDGPILLAECDLNYEANGEATVVLAVQAARDQTQEVFGETIRIEPDVDWHEWTEEVTGNRMIRMVVGAGTGTVSYRTEVRARPYQADEEPTPPQMADSLPAETLRFLRPSRYAPADQLAGFAFNEFGERPPTRAFATEIADWVRAKTIYRGGASGPTTTALDTLHAGAGVCRDFVHLTVALCRALGMPARYVSAYAAGLKPPDFHALAEVYCEGSWLMLDPTGLSDPSRMIRIAQGYDAAEVPFATWFGPGIFTNVSVGCSEKS